jgi:tetratricopeptide (TPR) repeat protein
LSFPEREEVLAAFSSQLIRFIDKEIYPQVARLEELIESRPNDLRWPNKLGVLYARYGRQERAQEQFDAVLQRNPHYPPTLLNLGNLHYLKRQFNEARGYYERAWSANPDSATAALAVARVNHEMENYDSAREAYDRLQILDPSLAEEFAYIDLRGSGTGRAAATRLKGIVVWDEAETPE